MRIRSFEWDGENINHVVRHGVNPEEVEEVVSRYRGRGIIRVITARDRTDAEKRLYQKRR